MAQSVFTKQFHYEVLKSERMRVTIIAVLFSVLTAGTLLLVPLFRPALEEVFTGGFPQGRFLIVTGLLALYGWLLRWRIGVMIEQQQEVPLVLRYGNALVEASIPTALMLAILNHVPANLPPVSPLVLIYGIFITLSILRLEPALSAFTGFVAALEYILFALLTLDSGGSGVSGALGSPILHLSRGVTLLVGGLVAGVVARAIRQQVARSVAAIEEREKVLGLFGQHVSPQVVNRLLAQSTDDALTELRDVCVMFVDIRDFTTFAEARSPQAVVAYLNQLFGFMIEIVNDHDGIINKFLGDGFMAVFGAPLATGRDVDNAINAARAIVTRVEQEVAAGRIPPTTIGIGLHAGQAVTGSIGTEQRKEYTVIGDVVNLASRIEQLNKQYESRLLVSESVYRALNVPEGERLGAVQVKGREAPVEVYRLA